MESAQAVKCSSCPRYQLSGTILFPSLGGITLRKSSVLPLEGNPRRLIILDSVGDCKVIVESTNADILVSRCDNFKRRRLSSHWTDRRHRAETASDTTEEGIDLEKDDEDDDYEDEGGEDDGDDDEDQDEVDSRDELDKSPTNNNPFILDAADDDEQSSGELSV